MLRDETDSYITAYGIAVKDSNNRVVESYNELLFDKLTVSNIISLLNSEQPDITQLQYIIEDFISI